MDIARRLYVLTLVTAAAVCAYVVYRVYWRDTAPYEYEPWPDSDVDVATPTTAAVPPSEGRAPAEADTIVPAVGRTSASPAARYDDNGAPVYAPPATVPAQQEHAVPARKKPLLSGTVLAVLGALAAAAAIGLGAWAVVVSTDSDEGGDTSVEAVDSQELISVLSRPTTERIPLAGSEGRIVLVAAPNGKAYLVLNGLGLAPEGKSYQAWVIRPGAEAPASAAVFEGSELVVPLALAVQPGAVVAITIERAGGVRAPTQTPTIVGERT